MNLLSALPLIRHRIAGRLVWAILLVAQTGAGQTAYDRHVIFADSASAASHHHSEMRVVPPSTLEPRASRIPVDDRRFFSAPNSLRLRWKSAPGGDWSATLKVPARYARSFRFEGDALKFRVWADAELTAANTPRISVRDDASVSSPTIDLVVAGETLPAGRWVQVVLPFSRFVMLFNGTDDTRFDPSRLASITFVQGLDDGREHTLWIDDVAVEDAREDRARTAGGGNATPVAAPSEVRARGYERHADIAWKPVPGSEPLRYRIERAGRNDTWIAVGTQRPDVHRFADFPPRGTTEATYRVVAQFIDGTESAASNPATARLARMTDARLLDMVQEGCFRYYWDAAHPEAGLAPEILPGDPNLIATGGNGFGIMALLVATERGFVTREAAVERMTRIVRFLAGADRFHGIWPHFLDGRTGRAIAYFGKYDDGGDLVETAFLMQGLLAARQYFEGPGPAESEIRATITRLWQEAEWDWYRRDPSGDVLYWHWSPNHGFHIRHPLIGWNETLIVYLLAIASPTHPVPASLYHSGWAGQSPLHVQYRRNWGRTTDGDHYINGRSYYGHRLDVGVGNGSELFFTHFSFLGFDPRGIRDRYANYFDNNRAIALINHDYCVENPRDHSGYGRDCWGLSAGIMAGGGRPLPRDDNGTISCMASLASFPYTPRESMAALKHFYRDLGPRIWGAYGFHDGFNATLDWYDEVYMALNQGPIVVMIENHRSGLVWNRFMANPEIRPALERIGFVPDDPRAKPRR